MSSRTRGFGNELRRFALSVDIVDESTFDSIRDLVGKYVTRELAIEYFEVEEELAFGDEPGLQTLWSSDGQRRGSGSPIRKNGTYVSQTGLAYGEEIPLWVVAKDRELLEGATEYLDLWSNREDLPPYRKPVPSLRSKTSIILPMRYRRTVGAIYLESPKYHEITEVAKDELCNLADAIAVLWTDRIANRIAQDTTRRALAELNEILEKETFPNLAKPQVFVSSSAAADREVVGIITGVLSEKFGSKVNLIDWKSINEAGPVAAQLERRINESKFGICYLSEPAANADANGAERYTDNPNVLFEAGMIHGVTHGDPSAGWIPVREAASPATPFDFAHHRLLEVPRKADGTLEADKFAEDLTGRMRALLEPE